jgi:hypothetical protein
MIFQVGSRVAFCYFKGMKCQRLGKIGTIVNVRDDEWERRNAVCCHYHVEYDDGSFDTYVSENNLVMQ